MDLTNLTHPDALFPDVEGSSCKEVLNYLVSELANKDLVKKKELLLEKLLERENLCSTGLGRGIAVPHCKVPGFKETLLAVGLHRKGISYEAPDEQPVRAFFLLISPKSAPIDHLQALAEISHWVQVEDNLRDLFKAKSSASILKVLSRRSSTE